MELPYYKNRKDCKVTLTADVKYGEIWKYGYGKKYWDFHPKEWSECLINIEKRNFNNEIYQIL